jgi:hypothetical protein
MVKSSDFGNSEKTILDEKGHETKQTHHLEDADFASGDVTIDPALDKRLTRKFDKHVMPWLFGLFLFAFIDRSNIGNARIDGLATDLHLDANKFNVALAVFYVPYICVDVCYYWLKSHLKMRTDYCRSQAIWYSSISKQATTFPLWL